MVRNIELKAVLQRTGAVADKNDPAKWHTSQGVICVTDHKFFNWSKAIGGGGAIDLMMHLDHVDFIQAVCRLAENFPSPILQTATKPITHKPLVLPKRNNEHLPQITRYLTSQRYLAPALVRSLIGSGKLYADDRANAIFLLLGKEKTAVGAEIRGTSKRPWHALAPGSRKDLGCFYVNKDQSTKAVICESAIDALSYYTLNPDCLALSTAGAHPSPLWLSQLINKGFELFCGFDADEAGDALAEKMIALYPGIKRLRPTKHDWNDVLKYSHRTPTLPGLS